MTHLDPHDFVDALDGADVSSNLTPAQREHLATCDDCRHQVEELRGLLSDVSTAGDSHEPSPLFWEHFSRRVQEATAALPVRTPWWQPIWRPLVAISAVAAAVLLAIGIRPNAALTPVSNGTSSVAMTPVDEESMNFIVQLASDLSVDEFQEAARPTGDATAAVIDELTPEQRSEMIRLIQAKMGGIE
jgi:hypothetical protein